MNVDATVACGGTWDFGVVVRNEEGRVMAMATWSAPSLNDVATVEAMTERLVHLFALDCCFWNVEVELDSLMVWMSLDQCLGLGLGVRGLTSGFISFSYMGCIVAQCKKFAPQFRAISFQHVYRRLIWLLTCLLRMLLVILT